MSSTRRTVVCTGKKDEKNKDRTICGGGGWWGDNVPTTCPKCGTRTQLRGVTTIIPLTEDLS